MRVFVSDLAANVQAQNEMALLKAHADKEQAQFETEWRELGRVLEQDRRLKERMAGQDRGTLPTPHSSTVSPPFFDVLVFSTLLLSGVNYNLFQVNAVGMHFVIHQLVEVFA